MYVCNRGALESVQSNHHYYIFERYIHLTFRYSFMERIFIFVVFRIVSDPFSVAIIANQLTCVDIKRKRKTQ